MEKHGIERRKNNTGNLGDVAFIWCDEQKAAMWTNQPIIGLYETFSAEWEIRPGFKDNCETLVLDYCSPDFINKLSEVV